MYYVVTICFFPFQFRNTVLCFVSFLVQSDELKECLSNPHVRDILKSLVQSQTPEASIKEAMKEPIFLELAHACLKIVEPEKFQQELGKMF